MNRCVNNSEIYYKEGNKIIIFNTIYRNENLVIVKYIMRQGNHNNYITYFVHGA